MTIPYPLYLLQLMQERAKMTRIPLKEKVVVDKLKLVVFGDVV